MPALELLLNDKLLGTISTETLSVVRVDVSGKYGDEGLARLWVDGRREVDPNVAEGVSFVSGLELQRGQRISVKLLDAGSRAFSDKSELHGGGYYKPVGESYQLFFEIARRGEQLVATDEGESGFIFSLVWVQSEPRRTSVQLSTYAMGSHPLVRTKRLRVEEHIQVGQSAHLRIDA